MAKTSTVLTNQIHEFVTTDAYGQFLVECCDGKHDRNAILETLVKRVKDGILRLDRNGQQVTDEAEIRELLDARLDSDLEAMSKSAVLIA